MRRAGHSRLPRTCPSVRLQRVPQLLSLMSVTDERRIGYCGGNQCSGPGGLPLSLSCWRSSGAPLQQSGRDRRQTCRISKTSPAIPVACTDQTCRKQLVETASIRRLRVLKGCRSLSNYHSERRTFSQPEQHSCFVASGLVKNHVRILPSTPSMHRPGRVEADVDGLPALVMPPGLGGNDCALGGGLTPSGGDRWAPSTGTD